MSLLSSRVLSSLLPPLQATNFTLPGHQCSLALLPLTQPHFRTTTTAHETLQHT